MRTCNLITILGPTASGKTLFGAHLAHAINGEIISADSRQVYKGMDLGTGKDYEDYIVKGEKIPTHLLDIRDTGYKYNVFEFQNDFKKVFREIQDRNHMPVMIGGTGMYIEAVLEHYQLVQTPVNEKLRNKLEGKSQEELAIILKEYQTDLHNITDLKIRKRTLRAIEIAEYYRKNPMNVPDFPEIRSIIFGVKYDRNSRREMISKRLKARLNEGMIQEVELLLKRIPSEDLMYYGLEYKFITLYLNGKLNYTEMFRKLEIAIHQFAKRQMTWFRRMERKGHIIHWLDGYMSLEDKIRRSFEIIIRDCPELHLKR